MLDSYQTFEGDRCVDVFVRANGTFGYEEFRRDPEDRGYWTAINHFSGHEYPSRASAIAAARQKVLWFAPLADDQQ